MADRYALTGDWDVADCWSAISGGVGGAGVPAIGDNVYFDGNSGDMETTVNSAAGLGLLDMTGFTGKFTARGGPLTMDVDGPTTLGGEFADRDGGSLSIESVGSIEILAGAIFVTGTTITHNSAVAAAYTVKTRGLTGNVDFVVNNAGVTSLTSSETGSDKAIWKTLNVTSAAGVKYNDGGNEHEIGGNLVIGANASLTSTGKWIQTASGNVSGKAFGNIWAHLALGSAGVTSTLTAAITWKKFEHGSGTVTGAAHVMWASGISADDFWIDGTGPVTVSDIRIYPNGNRSQGPMTANSPLVFYNTNGSTLTMTGPINLYDKDLLIACHVNGMCTLDLAEQNLTCGAILLGHATTNTRLGKVMFGSGLHEFTSLQSNMATAVGNEVDFDNSHIDVSGTILGERNAGTMITFTHGNAEVHGGTITKCDLSGTNTLYPHECTDGTGNTNIVFGSAPPGSLMLSGVGR